MATYKVSQYAAQAFYQGRMGGFKVVVGTTVENDIVKHPFKTLISAFCTSNTALAAASKLHALTATAGQVQFVDGANTLDTISFMLVGI